MLFRDLISSAWLFVLSVKTNSWSATTESKATDNALINYGVLFYMIFIEGGSKFESVEEVTIFDHFSESFCIDLSCVAVYYGAITWLLLKSWSMTIQIKDIELYVPAVLYFVFLVETWQVCFCA